MIPDPRAHQGPFTTLSDEYSTALGDAQDSLCGALDALREASRHASDEQATKASEKLDRIVQTLEEINDSLEDDWATDPEIEE